LRKWVSQLYWNPMSHNELPGYLKPWIHCWSKPDWTRSLSLAVHTQILWVLTISPRARNSCYLGCHSGKKCQIKAIIKMWEQPGRGLVGTRSFGCTITLKSWTKIILFSYEKKSHYRKKISLQRKFFTHKKLYIVSLLSWVCILQVWNQLLPINLILFILFYFCAGYRYIVAFTKVLTIYQVYRIWIQLNSWLSLSTTIHTLFL
jgi:hypothetical protein